LVRIYFNFPLLAPFVSIRVSSFESVNVTEGKQIAEIWFNY